MGRNPRVPLPSEELLQRAAEAIVRQWSGVGALGDRTGNGVTLAEARAAVERNFVRRDQLGPELAHAEAEAYLWVEPCDVVDITDRLPDPPGPEWTVYLDHGVPVLGRVEAL